MAKRPVFVPLVNSPKFVDEALIEFIWVPGIAASQKKKNVISLHQAAKLKGIRPILEISTKSQQPLGEMLSAFNLKLETLDNGQLSVESAFQGSKVFERGGPYREFYQMTGREIRQDERLRNSGNLIRFDFANEVWELEPKTAFYDWLYLTALSQNPHLAEKLLDYQGFTDIEFNPEKSFNCQARSAALYVAFAKRGLLSQVLKDKVSFLEVVSARPIGYSRSPKNQQKKML